MKKLKILIADDEEMLCDLYEMLIESEFSCETTKVSNGRLAIEALTANPHFDLIISDYTMPEMNGGELYLFNASHNNLPFILFSGGDIRDYQEFKDFQKKNELNHFFNKPFNDRDFLTAISKIGDFLSINDSKEINSFSRIKLSYYASHTRNAAEVYLKLSDNKFIKIIKANEENIPEKDLLGNYLKKGIDYIYVEPDFFKIFLEDIFSKFHQNIVNEKKAVDSLQISGFKFQVSFEGLNDVGISANEVGKINELIEEMIISLLNNPGSKEKFIKLCESEGFSIGHSILCIYIAGHICRETSLKFASTMKKICTAAFYHDISIFEMDICYDEMNIEDIKDPELYKLIFDHPANSANFLPINAEIVDDTKKIILEHHEGPNGDGYPKKLTASQISPLACLFNLSEQIAFCLIRNDFSQDRLKDFIQNSESNYNQGNFSQFFNIAKTIF